MALTDKQAEQIARRVIGILIDIEMEEAYASLPAEADGEFASKLGIETWADYYKVQDMLESLRRGFPR